MEGPDALTDERRGGRSALPDAETATPGTAAPPPSAAGGAGRYTSTPSGAKPARGGPRWLSLSNWPVSARLVAVVIVASLMGMGFGALRIADAVGAAHGYARITQLAVLGKQVTLLEQDLENERDLTVAAAALTGLRQDAARAKAGPAVTAPLQQALAAQERQLTDAQRGTSNAVPLVQQLSQDIAADSAFPVGVQDDANTVIAQIDDLDALRVQVLGQSPAVIIADYSATLDELFAFNDEISASSGDALLSSQVSALSALSQAKDQAAQQRAILYAAFAQSGLNDAGGTPTKANPRGAPFNNVGGPAALSYASGSQALAIAQFLQNTDLQTFQESATPAEVRAYLATETVPQVESAATITSLVTAANGNPQAIFPQITNLSPGFRRTTAPALWYADQSDVVDGMQGVANQVATQIVTRSQLLQHQAFESALIASIAAAAGFLLVLGATFLVGRTLVNPLRRLTADALEIATVRLPMRIAAAATDAENSEAPPAVEPIGVQSTDEIGRVARAFDQVHAEAVRLAGTEAQLRGSLNAMFISLSRRSVPLIDRLARLIDSMEQGEDDPDQLANLFAMDHMVTRMRRNSENLLVLAGEEPVRKWTDSVPLADVARAAAAEIEQYNRVALAVQPGIEISGQAAADTVHLLAELIENATMFSPQSTQVRVTVAELSSGGVLIEVRDDGVGISPARLTDMNWRLDHPPVIDVSVSRHMGLYAVSRLAARHGIKVRLRPGSPQGLSALVWLPSTLAKQGPAAGPGSHSRSAGTSWALAEVRLATPTRHATGRHRSGLLAASGNQPVLAGRGAHAGRPGTVWFAAKRPSGGPVKSPEEIAAGWRSADTGPMPWAVAHAGDASEPSGRTTSGLPRRVPRTSAYPGSNTPGNGMPAAASAATATIAPFLGAPSEAPAAKPAARETAPDTHNHEQAPLRRRSPEEARSRLSGFQLGTKDAVQAGRETGWEQRAGEENGR